MKYRTFRNSVALAALVLIAGTVTAGVRLCSSPGTDTTSAIAATRPPEPPAPSVPHPSVSPPVESTPHEAPPPHQLTTAEIRVVVEEFLAQHARNENRKRWEDCIPTAPFRATAVKFPAEDHARYSSTDQTLWSQLRLDLNRDGVDDEKWLLKDGRTYKREVLDAQGKTVGAPEYFK